MNTISLTVPVSTLTLTDGRATTTASVTNGATVPARITVAALADAANANDAASWTSVDRPLREIAAGATEQFTVTFATPPTTTPGTYGVRLLAYSADRAPEEYADLARRVELVVPTATVPPAVPDKRRWWPIAAIVAALVVVAAVVIYLVLPKDGGSGGEASASATTPTATQPATPTQLSPPNGAKFNIFPRTTTLRWSAVPGAASYTVEVDCMHCCATGKWCTDVGRTFKVVPGVTDTSYTFNFVGAQPGRWRVWAVSASGAESPKSDWWTFTHQR